LEDDPTKYTTKVAFIDLTTILTNGGTSPLPSLSITT
jgi:hypothetical protein